MKRALCDALRAWLFWLALVSVAVGVGYLIDVLTGALSNL